MKKITVLAIIAAAAVLIIGTTVVVAQQIDPPERAEEFEENAVNQGPISPDFTALKEQAVQNAPEDTWTAPVPDTSDNRNGTQNGLASEEPQEPYAGLGLNFADAPEGEVGVPAYIGVDSVLDPSAQSNVSSTEGQ